MTSGHDEKNEAPLSVYVVKPLVVTGTPAVADMSTEDLSFKDKVESAAVKLHDILQAVVDDTKSAANHCEWEVTVSGVLEIGNSLLGGQAQFNASIRIASPATPAE